MAQSDSDRRIVRTEPGIGTGSTRYYCDDGSVWETAYFPPPTGGTTGTTRGYVDGNRLRTRYYP